MMQKWCTYGMVVSPGEKTEEHCMFILLSQIISKIKMSNIKLLYIDLFCGAGGTSTGVAKARLNGKKCAKVVACVNHDANAIKSHQANHPDTLHFTEDIRTLELSPLVQHLLKMKEKYPDAYTVLWASLECTNFRHWQNTCSVISRPSTHIIF